jgi:hypothetical protein
MFSGGRWCEFVTSENFFDTLIVDFSVNYSFAVQNAVKNRLRLIYKNVFTAKRRFPAVSTDRKANCPAT